MTPENRIASHNRATTAPGGRPVPLSRRAADRHPDEDRHDAWRAGDQHQRDEDLPETYR
jgi:hypothetical protein